VASTRWTRSETWVSDGLLMRMAAVMVLFLGFVDVE
jgi:hypothetical protein